MNNFIRIQRLPTPEEWARKWWKNYQEALKEKRPVLIYCPECRKIQKRIFHKERRFRCSFCSYKGVIALK